MSLILPIGMISRNQRSPSSTRLILVECKATQPYVLRDGVGQVVANLEVPHERAMSVAPGVEGYDIGVRLPAVAGRYVATLEANDGHGTAQRRVVLDVR